MESHIFFWTGFALMLVHEMDAVRCKEWEIFPLLSSLTDKVGYYVFTAVHIPLYLLAFWALTRRGEMNVSLIIGLDIFFIVHIFLHLMALKHPRNQFTDFFSWLVIIGSGMAGLIDLILYHFHTA
jgi:hypothetical protein